MEERDSTFVISEDYVSSSEEEEEDGVQPVVNMPPTNFSNVTLQNAANVHLGNSAVYNGDVTVIVNPGVNGLGGAFGLLDRVQIRDGLRLTVGEQNNLSGSENIQLSNLTNGILDNNLSRYSEAPQNASMHEEAHRVQPLVQSNPPHKKLIIVTLMITVIIVPTISLAVIWRNKSKESSNTPILEKQPAEESSVYLNGTEGSAPFYSRLVWMANPAKDYVPLKHPVEYYIISHSHTQPCFSYSHCSQQVISSQMYHMGNLNWSDIGYNFLVGGDGGIYEGRGWDKVGSHARGYNSISIGISLIGNFNDVLPTKEQIKALKILIEEGVRLGKVDPNYKLIAHKQVSKTESPGSMFYNEMQNWPHWYPLSVGYG